MSEKVELTEAEKAVVVEVTVGEIQGWLATAWDLGYFEALGVEEPTAEALSFDNPWRD